MGMLFFIIGLLVCYYGVVARLEWLMFKKQGHEKHEDIKSPVEESDDEFDFLMDNVDKELQQNPLVDAFTRADSLSKTNKEIPFTVIKNKKTKSI